MTVNLIFFLDWIFHPFNLKLASITKLSFTVSLSYVVCVCECMCVSLSISLCVPLVPFYTFLTLYLSISTVQGLSQIFRVPLAYGLLLYAPAPSLAYPDLCLWFLYNLTFSLFSLSLCICLSLPFYVFLCSSLLFSVCMCLYVSVSALLTMIQVCHMSSKAPPAHKGKFLNLELKNLNVSNTMITNNFSRLIPLYLPLFSFKKLF